jgi:hypothetical protein
VATAAAELEDLHLDLTKVVDKPRAGNQEAASTRLQDAAERVGHAWCGSWTGCQANVYYRSFQPPESRDNFSAEWGLMNSW